jgi:hypothetical protein
MFKPTALIIVAAIAAAATMAAGGAYAQELQPTSLAAPAVANSEGRADALTAAAATEVAHVAEPAPTFSHETTVADGGGRKAKRPRKEYPNVMGMSIHEWLASRQL